MAVIVDRYLTRSRRSVLGQVYNLDQLHIMPFGTCWFVLILYFTEWPINDQKIEPNNECHFSLWRSPLTKIHRRNPCPRQILRRNFIMVVTAQTKKTIFFNWVGIASKAVVPSGELFQIRVREIIRGWRLTFWSGEIMDRANAIIVCIMFGAWIRKIRRTSLKGFGNIRQKIRHCDFLVASIHVP